MSGPLVLITGITGFLSAHVLDAVLASPENYKVRGTLRSVSKKDGILSRLSAADRERVEFVEVADTATSDLLPAVRGVSIIHHVASPYQLNVQDAEKDLLIPAVEGTLNILRFAKHEKSVKKIVITSSFAAVTNFKEGGPNRPGFTYTAEDWNPSTYDDAIAAGGAGAFSYSVSKKLAEQAAWDYKSNEKPQFEIACINPPMIYGPSLQPGVRLSNLNTSSKTIYNLVNNADAMPEDRLPLFCHARDVGDAHVAASEKPEGMGSRWLLCGGKFTWAHAVKFIAETYPELKDRLPKGWEESVKELRDPGTIADLDTKPAETKLGIQFKDWQTTLKECIDNLLELEKRSDWKS
ncbi:NAD-dependent epimerase/dehydratase [Kalmanozyma brasiliensis GHG001]|uniref:Flavonol reductase n=1 Tax=Kalmanozyma brasiliensis (strain GHG001) TaxID=1365824 RepID=V5ENY6_KALBG|nr:NAD-dependent epimerase/dehydratase [Kalmanozyma brasiliensis GHG001]EST04638.1 NAD-dependent epimerase/dehydratase [Kalmanozyma brasiliensis GHG001]